MISVPAQVLQDLLWNYELNIAATGPTSKCEETMEEQCGVLQGYLTPEGYVDRTGLQSSSTWISPGAG
jgi:hypothetical protein